MLTSLKQNKKILSRCIAEFNRTPLTTWSAIIVSALSLALPASLYMMTMNCTALFDGLKQTPQITVFLTHDADLDSVNTLRSKVLEELQARAVTVVYPDQALNEFTELTGLYEISSHIHDNPFPVTMLVEPNDSKTNAEAYQTLANQISRFSIVDSVQFDLKWVNKLFTLNRLAWAIMVFSGGLMLLVSVVLIFNGTRHQIRMRIDDIRVVRAVGASNGFVAKPYVHTAIMQSLLIITLTYLVVQATRIYLEPIVLDLATLYEVELAVAGLPWTVWATIAAGVLILNHLTVMATVLFCLHRIDGEIH